MSSNWPSVGAIGAVESNARVEPTAATYNARLDVTLRDAAQDEERRYGAWRDVLDRFERDVNDAEDGLRRRASGEGSGESAGDAGDGGDEPPLVDGPWREPDADIGVLPEGLRERAVALLARQETTIEHLGRAVTDGRKQATLVDTMKIGADPTPVYLDTDG